jgi:hypothetical protein
MDWQKLFRRAIGEFNDLQLAAAKLIHTQFDEISKSVAHPAAPHGAFPFFVFAGDDPVLVLLSDGSVELISPLWRARDEDLDGNVETLYLIHAPAPLGLVTLVPVAADAKVNCVRQPYVGGVNQQFTDAIAGIHFELAAEINERATHLLSRELIRHYGDIEEGLSASDTGGLGKMVVSENFQQSIVEKTLAAFSSAVALAKSSREF